MHLFKYLHDVFIPPLDPQIGEPIYLNHHHDVIILVRRVAIDYLKKHLADEQNISDHDLEILTNVFLADRNQKCIIASEYESDMDGPIMPPKVIL